MNDKYLPLYILMWISKSQCNTHICKPKKVVYIHLLTLMFPEGLLLNVLIVNCGRGVEISGNIVSKS